MSAQDEAASGAAGERAASRPLAVGRIVGWLGLGVLAAASALVVYGLVVVVGR